MLKKTLFFFYENWKIYTAIILIIITFLSLYPLKQQASFPGDDKLHHLLAYSLLTIGLGLRKPENYILILIFLSFYSGLIEIIQPYAIDNLVRVHREEVLEIIYQRIEFEILNPQSHNQIFKIDGKLYYLIRIPYTGVSW